MNKEFSAYSVISVVSTLRYLRPLRYPGPPPLVADIHDQLRRGLAVARRVTGARRRRDR